MANTEVKWCQSCAMPMESADVYGTNADGSKNDEYCNYCFANGSFTSEQTMEEMIETCVPYVSKGEPWPDEQTARAEMQKIFPQLKRWQKE